MAINLAFIDFIVPLTKIRELYPGGWVKCLYDHRRSIGGNVYFDRYLFHTGSMSAERIELLIERWSELGFETSDFCVVESLLSRERHPCDWLTINEDRTAHLTGAAPRAIAGRRLFYERRKTKEAQLAFKMYCRRMRWTAVLMYRMSHYNKPLAARLNSWLAQQLQWKPAPVVHGFEPCAPTNVL